MSDPKMHIWRQGGHWRFTYRPDGPIYYGGYTIPELIAWLRSN